MQETVYFLKPCFNEYTDIQFFQTYVTDCVGVGIVGASVIVWGTFATLSSFGSGWLMRFTTSYVMVLVCIGGLGAGSVIFLIVWERQPSFVVIFTMASIFGLCCGLNATVALGECACTYKHACLQLISDVTEVTSV